MSWAPFTPQIRSLGPSYIHNETYIRFCYDPNAFFSDLDKTLPRFGDCSIYMHDVRADQNVFENAFCQIASH